MISRRGILLSGAAHRGRRYSSQKLQAADETPAATQPVGGYTPVTTLNGATLPYVRDGEWKVFHLIAEPVKREFAPGMIVNCWGITATRRARRSKRSRATRSASMSPTNFPSQRPFTGTAWSFPTAWMAWPV